MFKNLILLFLLASFSIISYAGHMYGGNIRYACIGNNTYQVELLIQKDPDGIDLKDDLMFNIYNDAGKYIRTEVFDGFQRRLENINLVDKCEPTRTMSSSSEFGMYTKEITLDNTNTGYTLAISSCCSPNNVLNIDFDQGVTSKTYIPKKSVSSCNSSPLFNTSPPDFLCANDEKAFDLGAIDLDGDQLKYSLCNTLHGRSAAAGIQSAADESGVMDYPPFESVQYLNGFSGDQPFGTDFTIDENTGVITGTPNLVGDYQVTVCIDEYRDGVLIGTSTRTVFIKVSTCSVLSVGEAPEGADGYGSFGCLTYQFLNTSYGATSYQWDFGFANDGSDQSTEKTPEVTFPEDGTYTVTLIATDDSRAGQPCRDTLIADLKIETLQNLDFDFEVSCLHERVNFYDRSIWPFTIDSIERKWLFGDDKDTIATSSDVTHQYDDGGIYKVGLLLTSEECGTSFIDKTVFIPSTPVADFEVNLDTQSVFDPIVFHNKSKNYQYIQWDFGDGDFSYSGNDFVDHKYDIGEYEVTLHVSDPDNKDCVHQVTKLIKLNEFAIEFPTAFSPNNDGLNDELTVIVIGTTDIEFKVYNRWGEVVYQSNDEKSIIWDGTDPSGAKKLPSGTYTYTFTGKVAETGLEFEPKKGFVNLIR